MYRLRDSYPEEDSMDVFEMSALGSLRRRDGKAYLEFLRVSSMSAGVYVLSKAGVDLQAPHTEDEIYYIANGQARIRVGSDYSEVRAGSIVYVPAGVEHRFTDISEELTALVLFAPAERSTGGRP